MNKEFSAGDQNINGLKFTHDNNQKPAFSNSKKDHKNWILVVDDNSHICEILSHLIRSMGFNVLSARNGIEGIAVFREKRFDLVLTDKNMPGMDGWLFAKAIKEISPGTSVILLTGDDGFKTKRQLKKSSVDSILFKPFDLTELEKTIRHFLNKAKDDKLEIINGYTNESYSNLT